MPKAVLILDHAPDVGGAQMALARLVGALPTPWTAHAIVVPSSGTASEYAAAGVQLLDQNLPAGFGFKRDAGVRALLKSLPSLVFSSMLVLRWMRSVKPQVAVANTPKSLLVAVIPALLTRTPLLWFVRDRVSREYVPNAVARHALLWIGRYAISGMLYNSKSTRRLMRHGGPVIYSPIDDRYFEAIADEPPNSTIRLVTVGRIDDVKGQDLVVEALAAVDDIDWELDILGEGRLGHEASEARLRSRIDALGLASRCHMVGHVNDVAGYIDRAHILVHYSRLPEALGQVLIQGMARGRCVVASKGGGASELIDDGVSGVLVEPNSPSTLAAVLRELCVDVERRRRIGLAAAHASKGFTIAACGAAFTEVLNDVASASPQR